jgi:hypothetical protein
VIAALAVASAAGCSDDDSRSARSTETVGGASSRCVVRLHGKGGAGSSDETDRRGFVDISPTGNADGWNGRQWLYFPDGQYAEARDIVVEAVEGCTDVIIDGFSNGASFAAKLYCRGEDLDGRLIRVVVDDPVPDRGVVDCKPDPAVDIALYWTGALEATARPGWDCADADWTCEGGTTIGIGAYAEALGTETRESVHDDHAWYRDAPELSDWG